MHSPLISCIVSTGLLCFGSVAAAQPTVPAKVCQSNVVWYECAKKVKSTITATSDPRVALAAATEWSEVYQRLYAASARDAWSVSDQQLFEDALSKLWDEGMGKYLDASGLAFELALKKYLPQLAAALEWTSGPLATFFYNVLAPSPIANTFTEAKPDNVEINRLLAAKLPVTTTPTIKQRYPELFRRSYEAVKAKNPILKPLP